MRNELQLGVLDQLVSKHVKVSTLTDLIFGYAEFVISSAENRRREKLCFVCVCSCGVLGGAVVPSPLTLLGVVSGIYAAWAYFGLLSWCGKLYVSPIRVELHENDVRVLRNRRKKT